MNIYAPASFIMNTNRDLGPSHSAHIRERGANERALATEHPHIQSNRP